MSLFSTINTKITVFKNISGKFNRLPIALRIIGIFVIIGTVGIGNWYITHNKPTQLQFETTVAEIGTLVTSVSGTGSISSGNSTNITTSASGTVSTVYVSNGETVTKGQRIAELSLDEYGQERLTNYWTAYLDALEAVKTTETNKITADISMWEFRQDIIDAEENIKEKNLSPINPTTNKEYTLTERTVIDKTLEKARNEYAAAELKYKNADSEIQKARSAVTAAWRDYQEVSSTIIAPADGIISNLSLSPGLVIETTTTATNNSTGSSLANRSGSISATEIGKIENPQAQLQASVNLTQIDITKVKANQNVTITMDAYADKTFTGKVLSVNTSGSISSGVTSYPVTVLLDHTTTTIYPNMSVNATIITDIQSNVLLVPTTALQTSNGISTVMVLKDGKVSTNPVTTGTANDSQIVITSGLKEGDTVVTSTFSSNASSTMNTSSPFSGLNRSGARSSSGSNRNVIQMGGPPGF